jgi:hypothetical protein
VSVLTVPVDRAPFSDVVMFAVGMSRRQLATCSEPLPRA